MIAEGINPTSDSPKFTQLRVIEGNIKQMTKTINDKIVNPIPIIKPAIFIYLSLLFNFRSFKSPTIFQAGKFARQLQKHFFISERNCAENVHFAFVGFAFG